ncbi:MAG: YbdD/YjiX family protein [Candidatus Competibacteraceae bacterium]
MRPDLFAAVLSRLASISGRLGRHLADWRTHAAGLRRAWLCILGAPDYQAYLAHQREHHPETPPLSERDYVRWFLDRRYNKPGGGYRCC